MDQPLISVLLPAYNAELDIAAAIRSLLGQTYKNYELLIIDDGSTDNTVKVVESFNDPRIKLIRNEKNLKLPKTLNKAIDLAQGKYCARADADDLSMPRRFEKQVAFLESHPEVDVVGTPMYIFDPEKNILGGTYSAESNHKGLTLRIHRQSPLAHATIMAKTTWLRYYKVLGAISQGRGLRTIPEVASISSRFHKIPEFLYAVRDPGRTNPRKMLLSNLDAFKIQWRNWRKYGLASYHPLICIPLIGARFMYYFIAALMGRSFFLMHCKPLASSKEFLADKQWIQYCLTGDADIFPDRKEKI